MSEIKTPLLNHSRLLEVLEYNSQTGIFTWKVKTSAKVKVGDIAGRMLNNGYWQIKIDYSYYSAHRLAWFYEYGKWPNGLIDHINQKKIDNRISNLRIVDAFQNQQNTNSNHSWSSSGLKGVTSQKNGKWKSQIIHKGEYIYLGTFDCKHKAHAAYLTKKRELHTHWNKNV